MPRSIPEITSSDIPQAPNLARTGWGVTAIADGGATAEKIAEETDISARHVGYTIRAAQTLGLLSADKTVTPLGRTLLESEQESDEELAAFRRSIEESAI